MKMPFNPDRRQFLQGASGGFAMTAFAGMCENLQAQPVDPLASQPAHFAPAADRVIFIYATGGVSHVDTFDYKPQLAKDHSKSIVASRWLNKSGEFTRYLIKPRWNFKQYGKNGIWVSDLFPHLGEVIDDICVLNAMHCDSDGHDKGTLAAHTGSAQFARPSVGSWVSYGLGTENQNLPSFMVISPGLPYAGGQVWGSDFLPVLHQGTRIIPGKEPIANMSRRSFSPQQQQTELDLLSFFKRQHLKGREQDPNLVGRIKSFETAFGMQMAAPEAFDLSGESAETHALYGLKPGSTEGFGWQCLVARRLAERGVRFIELIDGDTRIDYNWDAHANMTNYDRLARNVDHPIAGLLKDLKDRGMMEDTLVVFATEFGREPFQPAPGVNGRGHHSRVYSSWLAGAGVKGGMVHGQSDELGDNVAKDVVTVHDFQATILHLLGIDHERLTYRHAGRNFRLTDVHGNVVKQILA